MNHILLMKSVSYRIYSALITFAISLALTGNGGLSLLIGSADGIFKIFSYSLFEHWWYKIVHNYKPCVIWLTGLSGAGKTTIGDELYKKLKSRNVKCIILDGDEIRKIFPALGFTKADRIGHNINVGYMASILEKQGYIVIITLVSPFSEARDKCRTLASRFIEVYVSTPLEVCEERDVKGLYKKARNKEIKEFTGIDSPYEAPVSPELTLQTEHLTVKASTKKIIDLL